MNGIGALAAVLFGIVWTIGVVRAGAPLIFPIFGILFVILGVVQMMYHYKNATGKNRYSLFDITEDERDPLEERFGESRVVDHKPDQSDADGFCPYCGKGVEGSYEYCPKCGRKLPK